MGRQEAFAVGGGGWTAFTDRSTKANVLVRFTIDETDGRARAVEAVVSIPDDGGETPALGTAIRQLLWGRIEALGNHPYTIDLIRDRINEDVKLMLCAARDAVPTSEAIEMSQNASAAVSGMVEDAAAPWVHPQPAASRRKSPRLNVPKGGKYPDSFYKEFAGAFSSLAAEGLSPAVVLSEVNGVARTTVHRWAREARRRGVLGAGRPGQIG